MSKTDNEFPNLEASVAEVRRLRDENARLRGLLIEHSIRIAEPRLISGIPQTPQTISTAPEVRRSAVGTAQQRIELFRSLFRGRDDVYASRWESTDGDLDTCRRQIAIGSHIYVLKTRTVGKLIARLESSGH